MLLIFGENDKKPNSAQKKELTRSLHYLLRKKKKKTKVAVRDGNGAVWVGFRPTPSR